MTSCVHKVPWRNEVDPVLQSVGMKEEFNQTSDRFEKSLRLSQSTFISSVISIQPFIHHQSLVLVAGATAWGWRPKHHFPQPPLPYGPPNVPHLRYYIKHKTLRFSFHYIYFMHVLLTLFFARTRAEHLHIPVVWLHNITSIFVRIVLIRTLATYFFKLAAKGVVCLNLCCKPNRASQWWRSLFKLKKYFCNFINFSRTVLFNIKGELEVKKKKDKDQFAALLPSPKEGWHVRKGQFIDSSG